MSKEKIYAHKFILNSTTTTTTTTTTTATTTTTTTDSVLYLHMCLLAAQALTIKYARVTERNKKTYTQIKNKVR
jgi:hypothetical protein